MGSYGAPRRWCRAQPCDSTLVMTRSEALQQRLVVKGFRSTGVLGPLGCKLSPGRRRGNQTHYRETRMRFLIKISWPVEAGNRAAKEGFKAVPSILEEIKPEKPSFAARFLRRCQ